MAFTKSIILWQRDSQTVDEYEDNILGQSSKYMNKVNQEIDDYVEGVTNEVTAYFTSSEVKPLAPKVKTLEKYETLSLDLVTIETHDFTNEITGYPISDGFQISEHVIKKNPKFSIQGWVTDVAMPKNIVSFNTLGKIAGSMFARDSSSILGSLLSSAGNVVDNLGYENASPVKDAFITLQDLVRNGTLVHVATILGTYENCVLRSVNIQQNVTNSTVLPVVLQFEKVYIIAKNRGDENPLNYVDPDVKAMMEEVKNDTTGSYLDDLYGQLTKQGVNIVQAVMGVSYNGSEN